MLHNTEPPHSVLLRIPHCMAVHGIWLCVLLGSCFSYPASGGFLTILEIQLGDVLNQNLEMSEVYEFFVRHHQGRTLLFIIIVSKVQRGAFSEPIPARLSPRLSSAPMTKSSLT